MFLNSCAAVFAACGGLQRIVHFGFGENAFGARGIIAIFESACGIGLDDEIEFSQAESLAGIVRAQNLNLEMFGRNSEQRLGVLRTASGDDRDRSGVGGLVAKSNAEAEGEQQWEHEYPEDDLGFALEFEQARGQ